MRSQPNHTTGLLSLSVAFLPLFLLIAAMKIQRGITLGSVDSISSGLLYVLIEISLFLLLTVVIYTLSKNVRQPLWRSFLLLTLCSLVVYMVIVEITTHELFRQTGLLLNWSMFLFGFERAEMVFKALEQQVSTSTTIYFIATLLYLVIITALFTKKLKNGTEERYWFPGIGIAATLFLGYGTLIGFSTAFGFPQEEFRGASSHLVFSYFESKSPEQQVPLSEPDSQVTGLTIPVGISVSNEINIVIIILESTRQRSVAPYVDTEVTPYFSELAENSLLAEHAYSTTPHTSRAIYSILCGQFPRAGKAIVETMEGGIRQACLPHLLTQQGYASVFFQSATEDFESRAQLVKNMGFPEFFPLEKFDTTHFEKSNYFGYEDNIMLPASQAWLEKQDQPFLATYLTVTPHFHYDAISRYGWKNYVSDKKYNAYLNTLHYQDNFLRNLIQQYKDFGLYQNTLFVILGDHGEAFREHGLWGHGNILFEEGVKVPLILHHADNLIGKITPRVSLLDVVPTILRRLQFDGPDNFFPGQDLNQPVEERDILLECISPNQCSSLIDAETGLKLIHNYGRKPDKLFDLSVDPKEDNDLVRNTQYHAINQTLLARLRDRIDEVTTKDVPQTFNSWAYLSRPVTWTKELPEKQVSFQNKIALEHVSGNAEILGLNVSKSRVFAGDSFNLVYSLPRPNGNICVDSLFEGVKRHKRRTHNVEPSTDVESAYFQISENLQILPDASTIKVDISTKSACSSGATVLSRNLLVIDIPVQNGGDIVFSPKYNQLFERQPLPQNMDTLNSTIYLNELLDQQLPIEAFSTNSRPLLHGAEFVEKIRENLSSLRDKYGEFETSHLDSIWNSKDGGVTVINRYRVYFSTGLSMDFRVIARDSQVAALYYYHPWNKERPL